MLNDGNEEKEGKFSTWSWTSLKEYGAKKPHMVLRLLPGKTYIIASVSLKKGCKGDTNLQLLGTNVTGINTEGVMSDTTE